MIDVAKYQKIFEEESEDYLQDFIHLLLQAEKDPDNKSLLTESYGKIHSIKGMAKALSMERVIALCQSMEEQLKKLQAKDIPPTPEMIQSLLDCADRLKAQIGKGEEPAEEVGEIQYIKVRSAFIDELLGLTQEIILHEHKIPPSESYLQSKRLSAWIRDYRILLKTLHFRMLRLRLMSMREFADLFFKVIRDLAKEHGREIDFEVNGGEIEAEVSVLDRLREPFLHLFRNAIAHGIEPPDIRKQKGKNKTGKIVLSAFRADDSLLLKLSDDGKGIDTAALRNFLSEHKPESVEDLKQKADSEILNMICTPGFTTVSRTTDTAGRGIGMNVVQTVLESLGGGLTIRSEKDIGTEFSITLPVSLSVITAIIFEVGPYILAIPTPYVMGVDYLAPSSSHYDLGSLLGANSGPRKDSPNGSWIIKVIQQGKEMGLTVDFIRGHKEVLVKPVGELLKKINLFSGIAILENGDLAMLLDVDNLPHL